MQRWSTLSFSQKVGIIGAFAGGARHCPRTHFSNDDWRTSGPPSNGATAETDVDRRSPCRRAVIILASRRDVRG